MKTKKIISALVVMMLIISSLTFTAFAADDRQTIVVYPGFGPVGNTTRTIESGDGTPAGGGKFLFSGGISNTAYSTQFSELTPDAEIERPSGYTGYTDFTLGSIKKDRGVVYKPCASEATATAGWYQVYVERLIYYAVKTNYIAPDAMHVEVWHRDGISDYLMDTSLKNEPTSGIVKDADLVYIGTFYFDDVDEHKVKVTCPIARKYPSTTKVRFDYGGAKFVPVDGPESAKGYYNPVYGDTLADGINTTWYETTGTAAYDFDTASVKIPAASSLKIKYDANDDAKNAVAFTEGAIRFDMVWKNTTLNDASASVIIGKSAASNAEFRIYSEKVEYLENGEYVRDIPIHGEYSSHYYDKDDLGASTEWCKTTLSGADDRIHTMRLEISSPEALGDSTSVVNSEKTVRLIINEGTARARVMAMGTLPANSILNSADSDLTDNYIEFKNNGGTTDNADIYISNIGVMVPDAALNSDNLYATSYNELKYTDFKDEFDVDAGILTVETDLVRPAEITNTLLTKNEKPVMAILAPYAASGQLNDAPTIYTLGVLPGTKKSIRLAVDSKPYLDTTVKFFIWDSLDSLVPAQEMQRAYVD